MEKQKSVLQKIKDVKKEIEELQAKIDKVDTRIPYLQKKVKLCCDLNNIQILNVETKCDNDEKLKFDASIMSGPVEFKLSFISEEFKENTIPRVFAIKVVIDDHFQELEMRLWLRKCVKDNNIQLIFRGISEYAEKYTIRQNILVWLAKDFESYFNIKKEEEERMYTIQATNPNSNFKFFECSWSIEWSLVRYQMSNSVKFHINHEADTSFKDIISRFISNMSDSVLEVLKELAPLVVDESEKTREKSKNGHKKT